MFQITKLTLSNRQYPIECTDIIIEDILWPGKILRAVKVYCAPCIIMLRLVSRNLLYVSNFESNPARGSTHVLLCLFAGVLWL